MKKYEVKVTYTVYDFYTVFAENEDEARDKAREQADTDSLNDFTQLSAQTDIESVTEPTAEEIAENTERTHLLVVFSDRDEYELACSHFRTESDYYADQENDEFMTLYFPEEDCMIDSLESDIDEELCTNGFTGYHFESE